MATVTSDLSNFLVDVSPILNAVFKEIPLLSDIRMGGAVRGDADRKFQWPNKTYGETTFTLGANYTAGGTVTVGTGEGSNFAAGDIFKIQGHKDSNYVEIVFEVVSVATDVLTVTVINGTDTSLTATSPAQKIYLIEPVLDGQDPSDGSITEPSWEYSYLQLMELTKKIGGKAEAVARSGLEPGIPSFVSEAAVELANQMSWNILNSVLFSVGRAETSTKGASMKGLLEVINTSADTNRSSAGGGTMDYDAVNDLIEKLKTNGAPPTGRNLLVCSYANAREISSGLTGKITYNDPSTLSAFGSAVTMLYPDMPNAGIYQILATSKMEDYHALILNLDSLEYVTAANREGLGQLVNTTPAGYDGFRFTLRHEGAIKIMNPLVDHGVIYNITP